VYSVDELKQQNQDICALCDVLSVLMEQKTLHNNRYVCELMSRFREKVWMHLVFEDNALYAELARHHDQAVSETARNFHANARDIKKRFSAYVRRWCKPVVNDAEHLELVEESREIFRLLKDRVEYENTHMFPLLE
jgi:hypothetical protein